MQIAISQARCVRSELRFWRPAGFPLSGSDVLDKLHCLCSHLYACARAHACTQNNFGLIFKGNQWPMKGSWWSQI